MALFRSPTVAWLGDLFPSEDRSKANGVINLMGGVGGLLAFFGGGYLFNQFGRAAPFIGGAVLLVTAALLAVFLVKEPAPIAVAPFFSDFYDNFGGVRIFGYPITEPYLDTTIGRTVQYFQTMRLEYDSALPKDKRVQIASLGEWAFEGVASTPAVISAIEKHLASQGSLVVHDEFLAFYQSYQGKVILGPPISPRFDQDGRRVQYFHNGRLEWEPNQSPELRIQVSCLGEAHFEHSGAKLLYKKQGSFQSLPDPYQAGVLANLRAVIGNPDRSGFFVLLAILLWFIAFNALEAGLSSFAVFSLGISPGNASIYAGSITIAVILAAIPAGLLGTRIGRRRAIQIGLTGLTLLLILSYFVIQGVATLIILLVLLGVFWAFVNVNSLPLVYDYGDERKIGAYTGLYYFSSQSAAVLGPTLGGALVDLLSDQYRWLFLFSTLFMALAWLVMTQVRSRAA
jgi:MFS family permease